MTNETIQLANSIKSEISKLQEIISNLSYRIRNVKSKDQYPSNCNTPTSRFYKLKIKLFNSREENGNIERAKIIVFDNDNMRGSDFEVDEELILYIKKFFENKLEEKTKQFEELN